MWGGCKINIGGRIIMEKRVVLLEEGVVIYGRIGCKVLLLYECRKEDGLVVGNYSRISYYKRGWLLFV